MYNVSFIFVISSNFCHACLPFLGKNKNFLDRTLVLHGQRPYIEVRQTVLKCSVISLP